MKRQLTVRFSQVDPAGIVFYARYFEMLKRVYPNGPLNGGPFRIQAEFRQPNRWGDQLEIEYQENDDGAWSYSGQLGGNEHFRIFSLPGGEADWSGVADRHRDNTFTTRTEEVGAWEVDASGHMSVSRYFERVSEAVELWIDEVFGMPFPDLHIGQGIGMPTVRFKTWCRELPEAGTSCSIAMQPVKLGTKSVIFRSWLLQRDECLVETEQVVVFVKFQGRTFKSIDIPETLKTYIRNRLPGRGSEGQCSHVAS